MQRRPVIMLSTYGTPSTKTIKAKILTTTLRIKFLSFTVQFVSMLANQHSNLIKDGTHSVKSHSAPRVRFLLSMGPA